jgi:hypothetical protein
MNISRKLIPVVVLAFLTGVLSCAGGPPKPGKDITLPKEGVHLVLSDGWTAEVTSVDWTMWRRVQRGTGEEPWVIPSITATMTSTAPSAGPDDRTMNWRFKGVSGRFDPTVNPLTSAYPVPPGLWSLDPQKLDLIESDIKALPWPSIGDVQATVRLYENTHGTGETSALWHTYTVTFNVGPNAYEFVMSIPDTPDYRDWIDAFWASITDLSNKQG